MQKIPKIIFYLFLLFFYLLLAKKFSATEQSTHKIKNLEDLSKIIPQYPLDAILLKTENYGVFIKSFFFYLRVVGPEFPIPLEFWAKVSSSLYARGSNWKGYSIFQIKTQPKSTTNKQELIFSYGPQVPGIYFVGNPLWGRWQKDRWKFFSPLSRLPSYLLWESPELQRNDWNRLLEEAPFIEEKLKKGEIILQTRSRLLKINWNLILNELWSF